MTAFSWEVLVAFRRKVLGKLWSGHPIVGVYLRSVQLVAIVNFLL